jgi:translation initiation factor RLI1
MIEDRIIQENMYKLTLNDPYFLPHCGCDIELSLASGEIITLVGENGVGKTTLIERLFEAHHELMTLVDQRPLDLFYDRNLKQVKDFFLLGAGEKIDQEFFLRCWNKFHLEKKEQRMQSSLSGGEGQVLKICLSLAPSTDIYLLDEPSHYLDDSMKNILSLMLQELLQKKKSVIMIEHDLSWIQFPVRVNQLAVHNGTLIKEKSWTT